MKYDNQLRYAISIVNDYDGRVPLSVWLKDFFRTNKQMGSRDRKTVSEMVYGFYRLGHNQFATIEERILAGIYSGNNLPDLIEYFKPADHNIQSSVDVSKIFPWQNLLSEGIDKEAFSASFLIQPDLFLRIRPGKREQVLNKLNEKGIQYNACDNDCISLPNATKIDDILEIDKEAVIQDRSSQRTGRFFNEAAPAIKPVDGRTKIWDCCAASGGKSIMAYDIISNIDLTVSDIRPSIINNLKDRFRVSGIEGYHSFIADLTSKDVELPSAKYNIIIADVPCSGSGTWARTPEQLYFFKEGSIDYYSNLQKNILSKVIPFLQPGSALLYITCSVFAKENEDVVKYIREKSGLNVLKQELIKGYNDKADTMFAALFTN